MSGAWLDVMPAIPLAEAVPIIDGDGLSGVVVIALDGGCGVCWDGHGYDDSALTWSIELRVDLDHSQGLGYSLRWLGHKLVDAQTAEDWRGWLMRWTMGQTTDADRLALAKACAEVAS